MMKRLFQSTLHHRITGRVRAVPGEIVATKRLGRQQSSTSTSTQPRHTSNWKAPLLSTTSTPLREIRSIDYVHFYSLPPLEADLVLDRHTKWILHLLQQLERGSATTERVTSRRIHVLLDQLLQLGTTSSEQCWRVAERGRLILESLEQGLETLRRHQSNEVLLPIEVPDCDPDVYWKVLRLYANKYLHGNDGSHPAPQTCRAIVDRMQASGKWDLQPTAKIWNQVLSALANSNLPDRPLQAAQLLYQLTHPNSSSNNESSNKNNQDQNTIISDNLPTLGGEDLLQDDNSFATLSSPTTLLLVDASSFSHTLRACVNLHRREQEESPAFSKLAVAVARRVWKGLLLLQQQQQSNASSSIPLESFHVVHMLRVARNLTDAQERDDWATNVLQVATEKRLINVHVLQEVLNVTSGPEWIQSWCGRTMKEEYSQDPLQLVHQLPKEWIMEQRQGGDAWSSSTSINNPLEW